ncbi:hypothetical protein JMJ77_0010405 [Colletotrichum scovillei]|uniref:Uncharacterized protein n=1 Tax=Colletotrichum scovillei TaxID=1209932 RepID=A0A9P7QSU2_9PEZI|nr:hypothetical protein JMJ78_0011812 [Colletotrichum scovillei]KAG7042305.1 hypothetical protein JMJ77_0010405 [Colletotrichum scovillei]KAG7062339.1 hypothetical protein JMJ76_0006614 [Colletotrichum scovillei]
MKLTQKHYILNYIAARIPKTSGSFMGAFVLGDGPGGDGRWMICSLGTNQQQRVYVTHSTQQSSLVSLGISWLVG